MLPASPPPITASLLLPARLLGKKHAKNRSLKGLSNELDLAFDDIVHVHDMVSSRPKWGRAASF